jgi:hypothetical protein
LRPDDAAVRHAPIDLDWNTRQDNLVPASLSVFYGARRSQRQRLTGRMNQDNCDSCAGVEGHWSVVMNEENNDQGARKRTAIDPQRRSLTDEIIKTVRDESIKKFAGWVIVGILSVLGFALLGVWFLLKDTLVIAIGGVPKGAVVAFDLNACPKGWSVDPLTISRVIVGAAPDTLHGVVSNRDVNGMLLTARHYPDDGGEEAHTLTPQEIPKHDQVEIVWVPGVPASNKEGSYETIQAFQTRSEGNGKSFSIMPPFTTFFYCRKDA